MKYDLIIIGAGPAGLTASLYAARAGIKVLVLEAKNYGGQILNASKIENYPGIISVTGFEFADTLYKQAKNLGVEILFEKAIEITKQKEVITSNNKYNAKAVILATGAENRKLGIEDDYIGRGISYCATCDGNFYKGKKVAVIGGGSTALEDAIYLSNIASKVYLIHRNSIFRGEKKYLEELEKIPNVEFVINSNVVKINGKGNVESIDIDNNGVKSNLEVSGVFIAIGQIPKNELFSNILDLDDYGYIKSIDGVHTNVDKIYVAGDTRVKKLRQLTTAVSDGAQAATTALEEMNV